jgi:hypothetical protein
MQSRKAEDLDSGERKPFPCCDGRERCERWGSFSGITK